MADAQQNSEAKKLSPPACCVVHGWVTRDVFERLERAGQYQRKHPDQIVAELVSSVYGDPASS